MKVLGVIPARLGSTRFPAKPLVKFFGKTMIEHTYAAATRSRLLSKVIVASDSERILGVIQAMGGHTMLTGTCKTGTDRIVQALHLMDSKELSEYDVVVNIQGDEPGVNPKHIDLCIQRLRNAGPHIVVSTLATPIFDEQDALNRNVVKCVADRNSNALYFSRAMIPHAKNGKFSPETTSYLRHVGMYAFRKDFLLEFPSLCLSNLEESEDLEQLRVLSAGYKIHLVQVDSTLPGVDTRADLEDLKAQWPLQIT
ncbi:unnamed protein product [Peronospora belbahrii]|uniref:3-deoxy-manno-octulosonate cytidylyltransferase n=1 Tax=Peronospora belbahrii TaxID=622444 RepID=A0AAU9LJM0_9STRA|nr:unnamed protein product [Peronospora belbahrii]